MKVDYQELENPKTQRICQLPKPCLAMAAWVCGLKELRRDLFRWQVRVFGRLSEAYPKSPLYRLIIQSVRNYFFTNLATLEYGALVYGNEQLIYRLTKNIDLVGVEYLSQVLKNKAPVVLIVWHIGNMFLPLLSKDLMIRIKGRKIRCVAPVMEAGRKLSLQNRVRKMMGIDFEFLELNADTVAMSVYRTLTAGGVIICTLDWAYNRTRTEEIDFFGRPMPMPVGIIDIARVTGAMGLHVCTPIVNHRKKVVFASPYDFSRVGRGGEELRQVARELNETGKELISRYPDQWVFWSRIPRLNEHSISHKLQSDVHHG